uniref:BUB1 N-terminal domain-containing protein n=2 Tax=Onchocerca TaxID=6281 RepID=A0A8R1TZ87_ONCVO
MIMEFFESLPSFVKALPEAKQLDYILNRLKWMEKDFEDEEIYLYLRKAIMEIILRYSAENNPFYNDKRLFDVFCIAGKLNHTMGMKRIMEKLHNRKQFYELAEFYVKWGEIFAKEKNRKRFNKIWDEATKAKAKPISHVNKAFRAMLYRYFQMADSMTDEIIVNLEKNESSEDSRVAFRDVETATGIQNRKLSDINEEQSDCTNARTSSIQPSGGNLLDDSFLFSNNWEIRALKEMKGQFPIF